MRVAERVPFLGRLAWRYALRHKGQTVRALLGLLIATTVLVAGLGVSDSVTRAVERGAIAQFGPVDVVVAAPAPIDAGLARSLAALPVSQAEGARGVPTLGLPGSVTNVAEGRAAAPVIVRGIEPEERDVLGPLVGRDGPLAEPGPGEVVLSDRLATRLNLRVGDVVALRVPTVQGLFAGGSDGRVAVVEARVSGIALQEGRSGYVGSDTALIPMEEMRNAVGLRSRVTQIVFAVDGDAIAVADAMREHLRSGGDESFDARADKAATIEEVRGGRTAITGFILAMSSFTLIAAALLSFALLSALVEERRAELGIGRALGLTRGEIAFTMTVEGAYYATAAALLGLVLGLVLLVIGIGVLSTQVPDEVRSYFSLVVDPRSIATSLAVGILVPLATIAFGSIRLARLDPARAIRGVADDPKGQRRFGAALGALVVAGGLAWSLDETGRLAGLPIALAGLGVVLAAFGWRKLAGLGVASGAALIVSTLYSYEFPDGADELDPLFTLGRGLILCFLIVALLIASPAPYDALARLAIKSRGPVLVTARYLVARRRAAGLTMAMIAIVVMVVTTMGTLFVIFSFEGPAEMGGYQIRGDSPLPFGDLPPLPDDLRPSVADVQVFSRFSRASSAVNLTADEGHAVGSPWGIPGGFWGVPAGFAENNTVAIVDRGARFPTDRDAWRAVARGEAALLSTFGGRDPVSTWNVTSGETLVVAPRGANTTREYVIAGFADARMGVILAEPHVDELNVRAGRVVLVRAAEGEDATSVAQRLTNAYQERGITFQSFEQENEEEARAIRPLLLVFQSFLGVGLLVGLSSTGILAARAVHERRREIGTMRALGFEEAQVRGAFLLESTLTTVLGVAVGAGVGILAAHSVWWRSDFGGPFEPPWLVLGGFAVVLVGLAGVAAIGPANEASRLEPAIAVRHAE